MKGFFELKSKELLDQSKSMTCSKIKSIRRSYWLTQENFAKLLNISYHTYKNWEIGHRHPCTSAVALLMLAEENPTIFLKKQKRFLKIEHSRCRRV